MWEHVSARPAMQVQYPHSTVSTRALLPSLYSTEAFALNYVQLLECAKGLCNQPATEMQIKHLEELTRGQSSNKKWFRYRAGRITASLLFQVCMRTINLSIFRNNYVQVVMSACIFSGWDPNDPLPGWMGILLRYSNNDL